VDPRVGLSAWSWAWQATLRITVATVAVPIVEELFWRAFLLRALIDWHRFERIPIGTFTWVSFLGTSLLSMVQHPDNWAVSVLCWFAYNGLLYWKKSILLLMITHGVTNLALYLYVIYSGDWLFW
jgi:CAAX prenyl protease-like protein